MAERSVQGRILIGLMSGTSLDGVSAAAVRFSETHGRVHAELLGFRQEAYRPADRARLESAMHQGTAAEYCRLHADLGEWLAEAACELMDAVGLVAADVAAVASHGQTLWHEPGHSSWQIGDASRIAERTGCAVIADFRTRDVAAGGQGAPLVPMADLLLFAAEDHWRALQNIGGIGNVTIVPPRRLSGAVVRAFDTGPGVVVLDAVVRALYGQPYDRDGMIAAQGQVQDRLVTERLQLPFFHEAPPKSTGRELFTPAFAAQLIADGQAVGATSADIVATATALTAASIADQYARFISEPVAEVLLSGGGARNPTLVRGIAAALERMSGSRPCGWAGAAVEAFDARFFDAEAKEAVAFALLGYLHLTGRAGNVPSATGARAPRILGALTPAVSGP